MAVSPARLTILGCIAAAHVAGIAALMAVKLRAPVEAADPVRVAFIDSVKPEQAAPLLPPVQLVSVKPVSLPEVPVADFQAELPRPDAITVQAQSGHPVPSASLDDSPRRVSLVEYLRPPSPRYPHESRKRKSQGIVVLRVLIDADGAPAAIDIERSSGDVRLDEAAREAVSRALFKPYREDGVARRVLVSLPIEFALRTRA